MFWRGISCKKNHRTFQENKKKNHSWAKFKIILVRKPGRKFYYFTTKFQGSGFSFPPLNQNIKVVVFPSNFWFHEFEVVVFPSNFWFQNFKVVVFPSNFWFHELKVVVFPSNFWFQNFKVVVFPSNFWKTTIIWQFFRVILIFSQECYYLKNKVGVVDFTKARGLVKFQSPRALRALGL